MHETRSTPNSGRTISSAPELPQLRTPTTSPSQPLHKTVTELERTASQPTGSSRKKPAHSLAPMNGLRVHWVGGRARDVLLGANSLTNKSTCTCCSKLPVRPRIHILRRAASRHSRQATKTKGQRPAHGHALCPSLAGVPVSGSGSVRRGSDTAAARAARREEARKGNVMRRGISGERRLWNFRKELARRTGRFPQLVAAGPSARERL